MAESKASAKACASRAKAGRPIRRAILDRLRAYGPASRSLSSGRASRDPSARPRRHRGEHARDRAWSLHRKLAEDTVPVGDLALTRVLLANDANYPWLILVPRRPALIELIDLEENEQVQLLGEVAAAARALKDDHRMRQAQRRRARQPGLATARARHRPPPQRRRLAAAGLGRCAARGLRPGRARPLARRAAARASSRTGLRVIVDRSAGREAIALRGSALGAEHLRVTERGGALRKSGRRAILPPACPPAPISVPSRISVTPKAASNAPPSCGRTAPPSPCWPPFPPPASM